MHHLKEHVLSSTTLRTLHAAIARMDHGRTIALLENAVDCEAASKAVAALLRNEDGLVVLHANPEREAKRDQLIASIARWAGDRGWQILTRSMLELSELHRTIETGYRLISNSLAAEALSKWRPELQISAILVRAAYNYDEILARRPAFSGATPEGINPTAEVVIIRQDGNEMNVDAYTSRLIYSLSNLVEFLGHERWFAASGSIRLPPLPDPSPADIQAADRALVLSYSWHRWSRWEREARYFDGTISVVGASELPNHWRETGVDRVFAYDRGEDVGHDYVAVRRLANQLRQNLIESYIVRPSAYAGDTAVHLPPREFIDPAELLACGLIAEVGHLDIEDRSLLNGLTLSEWVRGYSVLKRIAQNALDNDDARAKHLIVLRRADVVDRLTAAGLSADSADAFVSGTTFGKNAIDMFDAPLLPVGDDQVLMFGPSVANLDAGRAVLSNLPARGIDLSQKGGRFEARVIKFLKGTGLPAYAPPQRKFSGEQIQIDALLHWGPYLFLIECKNAAPASLHPATALNFQGEHAKNLRQVLRLKNLLIEHPQLLTDAGGPDPREATIVPILLYSTPFARKGSVDGIYTADFSMFTRFFKGPDLGIEAAFPVSEGRYLRHRKVTERIWKGEEPTPEDLIAALNDPWTIRHVEHRTQRLPVCMTLAPDAVAVASEFVVIELDRAATAALHGIDPIEWEAEVSEVEKAAAELRRLAADDHR